MCLLNLSLFEICCILHTCVQLFVSGCDEALAPESCQCTMRELETACVEYNISENVHILEYNFI